MKNIKYIISILVFILSFSSYSQSGNPNTAVGFECGGTGSSTEVVNKVYKLVEKHKYNEVIKLLHSKNIAEKFLAIIICEKLADKKKMKLAQNEQEIINGAYNSDELVYVCEGCDYDYQFKISTLLNSKDDIQNIRKKTENYFKSIL